MERSSLPGWPRLMRESLAAAYLGISASMLRLHGPAPTRIGRVVIWDRRNLDRWADALDGQPLTVAERQAEGDDILRSVKARLRAMADEDRPSHGR